MPLEAEFVEPEPEPVSVSAAFARVYAHTAACLVRAWYAPGTPAETPVVHASERERVRTSLTPVFDVDVDADCDDVVAARGCVLAPAPECERDDDDDDGESESECGASTLDGTGPAGSETRAPTFVDRHTKRQRCGQWCGGGSGGAAPPGQQEVLQLPARDTTRHVPRERRRVDASAEA